jgi:sigma-B regulation protein RsbU (phosphoserine phosphatase)
MSLSCEKKLQKLKKLLYVNTYISSELDFKKLLKIAMETVKDVMEAEASSLLVYDKENDELVFKVVLGEKSNIVEEKYRLKMGQGIAGWVAKERKPTIVNDVSKDSRFYDRFDKESGFRTRSIIALPLICKGEFLGVIEAINPIGRDGFYEEDVEYFRFFADQVALALYNAYLFEQEKERQKILRDIEMAARIQRALLPTDTLNCDFLDIIGVCIPAKKVGGDFYDYIPMGRNYVVLWLGDVVGKGIPASIYASIVYGALRSELKSGHITPKQVFGIINELLYERGKIGEGVALLYMVVDGKERKVVFSNSGLLYPIVCRDDVCRYLEVGGMPLGLFPNYKYKQYSFNIKSGDVIVIATDGFIDAPLSNGEPLGFERFLALVKESILSSSSAKEIKDSILHKVRDLSPLCNESDDMTMMVVKVL